MVPNVVAPLNSWTPPGDVTSTLNVTLNSSTKVYFTPPASPSPSFLLLTSLCSLTALTQSDGRDLIKYETVGLMQYRPHSRSGSRRPPNTDLHSAATLRGSDPSPRGVGNYGDSWGADRRGTWNTHLLMAESCFYVCPSLKIFLKCTSHQSHSLQLIAAQLLSMSADNLCV